MIKAILGRLNNEAKFLKKRLKNSVAPLQPLQVNTLKLLRNKRAEALIRANLRSADQPPKPTNSRNGGSVRSISSGGITTQTYRTSEPGSVVKIGGRVVSETPGITTHDLSFGRDNTAPGEALTPRKNISHANAQVRQANIKFQMGQLLDEVKPGDRLTGEPIMSDNGKNPRAALYKKWTNGVLASKTKNYGTKDKPQVSAHIDSTRVKGNEWRNVLGQKNTLPNLKGDLTKLAAGQIIKRLVGANPYIQGALLVNDVVGQATGTKPSDKLQQEFLKATANSIEERMKRGQRFSTPIPFRF